MPDTDATAAFTDALAVEDDHIADAREASRQLGIESVGPSVGVHLALVAAASAAATVLEIGTGSGVSGLWLLRGAPGAQLTSIDADLDHQQIARRVFTEAGVPNRQIRLIPGRSADVLPRMNEDSYDIVLVDGDPLSVADDVAAALSIVRTGGSVLIPHALQGGKVPNPARRDRATVAMREAIRAVQARDDVIAGLSETGDGLLHVIRQRTTKR